MVTVVMAVVVVAAVLCAIQALRAARLLVSALWLAGASAMIALLLYMMGAFEIAVIELSVGAGLVTILFVFAISVAGDETMDVRTIVPRPLAIGLVVVATLALAGFALRQPVLTAERSSGAVSATFSDALWQQRAIDVLLQIVLIFAGVLGVLGLLADVAANRRAQVVTEVEGLTAHVEIISAPEPAPGVQEPIAHAQEEAHQ